MKALVLACALQAAVAFPAATIQSTQGAQYRYPGGVVTVSFDSAIVTRAELDSWMRLSPNLSPYNDLLVPIDIRRCVPGENGYVGCEKGGKLRIGNVELNIRKMLAIKRNLDTQKVPQGLRPIVTYLSEVQSFALWRAQQQREFLLTRNVSVLRNQYDSIDSNRRCGVILQGIARSSQEKDVMKLVTVDWDNCVWALEIEKIGPYPKTEWKKFLASHKITEVATEDAVPE